MTCKLEKWRKLADAWAGAGPELTGKDQSVTQVLAIALRETIDFHAKVEIQLKAASECADAFGAWADFYWYGKPWDEYESLDEILAIVDRLKNICDEKLKAWRRVSTPSTALCRWPGCELQAVQGRSNPEGHCDEHRLVVSRNMLRSIEDKQ